jgi:hypothetical protein
MVQAVSSYRTDRVFGVGFCQGLRGAVSSSSMPMAEIRRREVVIVDAIPIAHEMVAVRPDRGNLRRSIGASRPLWDAPPH